MCVVRPWMWVPDMVSKYSGGALEVHEYTRDMMEAFDADTKAKMGTAPATPSATTTAPRRA